MGKEKTRVEKSMDPALERLDYIIDQGIMQPEKKLVM